MVERVQKILSQWGIASRRQAEAMIQDGRVRLNGAIAHLGQKADPTLDCLEVDGLVVNPTHRPDPLYLLMNKPIGYVSTCDDPWNRHTVLDLLPSSLRQGQGIHPVGRLDFDSTGALLLTNDGDLTFQLTHPRHAIAKTYHVWVSGYPAPATLEQWRRGVLLSDRPSHGPEDRRPDRREDRQTLPARVKILKRDGDEATLLEVVLREGRNRQIRRVAEQLGHPVLGLHRVAIGSICLHADEDQPLASGAYRTLTAAEVHFLKVHLAVPSEQVSVSEECRP